MSVCLVVGVAECYCLSKKLIYTNMMLASNASVLVEMVSPKPVGEADFQVGKF